MTNSMCMLNNGSKDFDEILEVGKMCNDVKGICFNSSSTSKEVKVSTKEFVPPMKKTKVQMVGYVSQQHARHMYPQYIRNKRSSWRCHHYGIYGHIRPFCNKLYGYP